MSLSLCTSVASVMRLDVLGHIHLQVHVNNRLKTSDVKLLSCTTYFYNFSCLSLFHSEKHMQSFFKPMMNFPGLQRAENGFKITHSFLLNVLQM